jgi:hypothetical protein
MFDAVRKERRCGRREPWTEPIGAKSIRQFGILSPELHPTFASCTGNCTSAAQQFAQAVLNSGVLANAPPQLIDAFQALARGQTTLANLGAVMDASGEQESQSGQGGSDQVAVTASAANPSASGPIDAAGNPVDSNGNPIDEI